MIITIYILLCRQSWHTQWGETLSFLKKHFYYHLNPAFSLPTFCMPAKKDIYFDNHPSTPSALLCSTLQYFPCYKSGKTKYRKCPKQSIKFINMEGKQLRGPTKYKIFFSTYLYVKLLCKNLTFKMGKSIDKPVIDDSCYI